MNFKVKSLLSLLLATSVWALPSQTSLAEFENTLESIDSRRGLLIEGNIKSVYVRSAFDAPADSLNLSTSPDNERIGFAQLDLSLGVRPWEKSRGTMVLRLNSGYQDFFNAGAKTVSVPWISLEGLMGESFYWTVGDFRQAYGPLSLFSPDVDVMYEAEIFRRNRYMARDQVFLEGNQRNLQGANLQFRQEVGVVGEIRAEALLARLRRIGELDASGHTGNIFPNALGVPGASQVAGMDKWLVGGNFELLPLNQALLVGFTPLYIRDQKATRTTIYRYIEDPATLNSEWYLQELNPGVLVPENTMVLNARLGFDLARMLGRDSTLVADVVADYAMSEDDHYTIEVDGVKPAKLKGSALLAQLNVGYNHSAFKVNVGVNYLMNDKDWFNPLAQSPAFYGQRVLNSDKDLDLMRLASKSPFYSTFDALYQYSPKFVPVGRYLGSDPIKDDQTESYNIAPFNKNSYSTRVYTRDELNLINNLNDINLLSVLPNGLASANRQGVKALLNAGAIQNHLTAQVLFSNYAEKTATAGTAKGKFGELGGGLSLDLGSWLWGLPLEFSGSFKQSTADYPELVKYGTDFINAGFYAKYHQRFGVSFGLQMINSTADYTTALPLLRLSKSEQLQWRAGLDYSLAKNTWVALNYGMINAENTYSSSAAVGESLQEALPDYMANAIAAAPEKYTAKALTHKFDRAIIEATINADF